MKSLFLILLVVLGIAACSGVDESNLAGQNSCGLGRYASCSQCVCPAGQRCTTGFNYGDFELASCVR